MCKIQSAPGRQGALVSLAQSTCGFTYQRKEHVATRLLVCPRLSQHTHTHTELRLFQCVFSSSFIESEMYPELLCVYTMRNRSFDRLTALTCFTPTCSCVHSVSASCMWNKSRRYQTDSTLLLHIEVLVLTPANTESTGTCQLPDSLIRH